MCQFISCTKQQSISKTTHVKNATYYAQKYTNRTPLWTQMFLDKLPVFSSICLICWISLSPKQIHWYKLCNAEVFTCLTKLALLPFYRLTLTFTVETIRIIQAFWHFASLTGLGYCNGFFSSFLIESKNIT
jgi:hypothetical protein